MLEHAPDSSSNSKNSALILIADDNKVGRTLLCQAMMGEGYRVIEAANGKECLNLCSQFKPDLILLDAVMPIVDGFSCCQMLTQRLGSIHVPVLMITSLENEQSIDRAFAAGAADYITKPIHWALLRQRVRRLLQAAQATRELQRQAERERLMGAIAQRIRQSLNLDEILETTVGEVRQLLGADRVLVYRTNPDGTGKIITESVGLDTLSILQQPLPDDMFPLECYSIYSQGRVRSLVDIEADSIFPCLAETLKQLQVTSKIVVPILQQQHLWGLLIAHQCGSPREWQPWEADLLRQLSTQVAIALQQSQLYHQVQQLNADLEHQVKTHTAELQKALEHEALLKRITDRVRDSLNESHILETAVQELAISLGVDCCDTALYASDCKTSMICYEYMRADVPLAKGTILQMDKLPEIYGQLLRGHYVQFCLANRSLSPTRNEKKNFTILSCPLMDEQGVFGDMWLFKPCNEWFSDLEIRLVEQVANQCAIAIRQARLYQTSQTQIAELERLHQAKDDFLSIVSHEMRSPMSNMRLAIQMLERVVGEAQHACRAFPDANNHCSKTLTYLHILRSECEREISLINDLLDLQRLEAGYESLNLDAINLQLLITDLVEPFEKRIQERQQTLNIDVPNELPFLVTDPVVLRRILSELITNACKYTPPHEVITISVTITPQQHGAIVATQQPDQRSLFQLRVINTGVELSFEEMLLIFDKFYRIPNGDPWQQGGTGLGLTLAKKLTGYLGGSIQVESRFNKTCFTVELPML